MDSNTVYVAASGPLTALDGFLGALRWQSPVSAGYVTPSVAGGLVWTHNGGSLTAPDAATGSLARSTSINVVGQPIVGDSVVAVGRDVPTGGIGVCVYRL